MDPNAQSVPLIGGGGGGGGGGEKTVGVYGDLLAEILVRLPAESLMRSKLVCKHWLSVISSAEFRRSHALRNPKAPPSLLLQTRTLKFFHINPFEKTPILTPYEFPLPNPRILSSCNGLMLLESDTPLGTEYYVHNPSTNKSRRVADLEYCDEFPGIMGFTLAFDPLKSIHYKIVLVRASLKPFFDDEHERHRSSRRSFRIEVYDSESCRWEKGSEPFTGRMKFSYGFYCNNFVFWGENCRCYDLGEKVIATISFSDLPWRRNDVDRVCVFQLGTDVAGAFRSDGETCTLVVMSSGEIEARSFDDESFEVLVDLNDQPLYNANDHVDFRSHNVYLFQESIALV